MRLVPLGDRAVLAYFRDEPAAIRFSAAVRSARPAWLEDVVPAYASVGVFFDADQTRLRDVSRWLETLDATRAGPSEAEPKRHRIPTCYEMAPDMARVARQKGLMPEAVIARHTGAEYTVYAIGFAPGFPYLGYLPEELCGVGRLPSPRLRVEPGSVGLTGRQTGLYPLPRPGGWNLIGRTPLVLVDVADGFFPLRVGDRVRFDRIDEDEFGRLEGERLTWEADPEWTSLEQVGQVKPGIASDPDNWPTSSASPQLPSS